MKPETILQSDVLDILFENRNKDYGAYTLRKNYNQRLIQAMSGTVLLVGLFILLQSMKPGKTPAVSYIIPDQQLTEVELQPDKPEEKKPDEKPRQRQIEPPTIDHQTPVITENPVETEVPTEDELAGRVIDDHTNDILPGDGDPPYDPGEPVGQTPVITTTPAPSPEPEVYDFPDVMPSFDGDIVRYMQRHLRQPDDLETGEKITVRVRFVVNEEGNISDIKLVQSGRRDLDEEVLRVVKKMPRWNPGMQGGRRVAVFFNMPVTFISGSE